MDSINRFVRVIFERQKILGGGTYIYINFMKLTDAFLKSQLHICVYFSKF
jgi:hypothetical protein